MRIKNFSIFLEFFINYIIQGRYKIINVIEKYNKLVVNFVELKVWGKYNFRNCIQFHPKLLTLIF